MKDFNTIGKTARTRYHRHPRSNTFDEFVAFCEFYKIQLNPEQKRVAAELFAIPYAKGKSMLIALLIGYDFSAQILEEEHFHFFNNGRSLQEVR